MSQSVCGRFAPTPSGRMHAGNVLCALLAWLSARSQGGRMVLRIEDLDPLRCPPENAALLEDDLHWLGLDWDEGGSAGGPHAPYYQSQCTDFYEAALQKLRNKGLLYPCFCSRAQLHVASAPHLSDGQVIYNGRCRGLTAEQIRRLSQQRPAALRLRVPPETIRFTDGCTGTYAENLAEACGDFLVRRSDGIFAYQLAVVVDDARMEVTEVVRGRDLLASTPRQLYLYRLLGCRPPRYCHIPLLLAPDGRRLSKRDHDLDLGRLRQTLPDARPLIGALAFLCGLQPAPEPVCAQDLLPHFRWSAVRKTSIRIPQAWYQVPPNRWAVRTEELYAENPAL
ncbi:MULTISPECIES: tRNA glutamyl-Q(34) synthetase GluQRS [Caproicibacterium]|uniref:Glutamyl-Q tRNA(Asp) synthetase n=1 Tax=Caproicibacterium argilliputei TaxID=3030016 RepID=A0AA97H1M8_9FIRM|nr:tRNA glutamyl-Q(34) synthetase GluQRS [Caproicibacterium argilliputei]WOC32671.1 tRNA glutamyl-Q(34) synthetase GluQRS [Caproicibacterium argilliputei]